MEQNKSKKGIDIASDAAIDADAYLSCCCLFVVYFIGFVCEFIGAFDYI